MKSKVDIINSLSVIKYSKQPKKGQKIAHINICSIRNNLTEITKILPSGNLHILAISEKHLDSTFEDA